MLKEKRPDIQIVGDELIRCSKVKDFAPYVAKIKASGADSVITGNWGNDMTLLSRRRPMRGCRSTATPTTPAAPAARRRCKQTGLDHRVFADPRGHREHRPQRHRRRYEKAFRGKIGQAFYYPRVINEMHMLGAGHATRRRRDDPKKVAPS